MKEAVLKCLYIEDEAWKYLRNEMHIQRTGKKLDEFKLEYWLDRYKVNHRAKQHGFVKISDDSFGGCIGEPTENACFEGRWTSWKIPTIKKMLDDKGYKYSEAPDIDVIYI